LDDNVLYEKVFAFLKKLDANESDSVNRMKTICNLHKFISYNVMKIVSNTTYCNNILKRMAAIHILGFLNDSKATGVFQIMLKDPAEDVI